MTIKANQLICLPRYPLARELTDDEVDVAVACRVLKRHVRAPALGGVDRFHCVRRRGSANAGDPGPTPLPGAWSLGQPTLCRG